ncbi:BLUF domain-containing protein [Caulobacter sp. 73W]|uniref:BLUF domain-containing protein n=1 Tax=Caulobacter sp. 73W TaxID=3161137 RepID=A0AB39KZ52_9CAUL
MQRIAYFSSSTARAEPDQLSTILASARSNNARLDITGLLCHYDGSFLQFLEGPPGAVEALYAQIARDRRHKDLVRVLDEPAQSRAFSNWSMALVDADRLDDAQQAFRQGLREVEITPGPESARLEVVLDSFRRWLR